MVIYFLVGLPGSGKSTWAKNNKDVLNATHISSDYFIEQEAFRKNKTYAEVCKGYLKEASRLVEQALKYAIKNKSNIILDQTNLSRNTRLNKLKLIPKGYTKICVFFPTPKDLEERLARRVNREISLSVIEGMKGSLEIPLKKEGWDKVLIVGVNDGN